MERGEKAAELARKMVQLRARMDAYVKELAEMDQKLAEYKREFDGLVGAPTPTADAVRRYLGASTPGDAEANASSLPQKVVRHMKMYPQIQSFTVRDLAHALGEPSERVRVTTWRMVQDNRLERTPSGGFRLAQELAGGTPTA